MDEPRLLAIRSELGYVDRTMRALPDEPEAVSSSEQRAMTAASSTMSELGRRQKWIEARDGVRASLLLLDTPAFASVARDVRAISRLVERIDARL